ncbi:zinc ribbon domain-containing protein [Paenibacillus sp. MER 78]|nr:zinc ribbon domain-containing protein [Paenibacillus sp. MER 78]
MCHTTGEVKLLSIREWSCPSCRTCHDRDDNAAQNIKRVAV